MASDKAYAVEQRLGALVGQLSGASNNLADLTVYTVTSTSLHVLADASATPLPGKDPVPGAVYRLTCYGHGTWGSSTQQVTFQNQLKGSSGTANLASVTIGANLFPVSQAFRWRVVCEWVCNTTGTGGDWFGPLSGQISTYGNSLLAADGANGSLGFTSSNFAPVAQDTTADMVPTLAAAWQSTSGGPVITGNYAYFQRVA